MEQELHTQINWLSRHEITTYLQSAGIACYDDESTEDLKAALVENVADGTIELIV